MNNERPITNPGGPDSPSNINGADRQPSLEASLDVNRGGQRPMNPPMGADSDTAARKRQGGL